MAWPPHPKTLSQADGLFIFDAPKTKQKGLGLAFNATFFAFDF
jgi:hypothetical protein